ncbi:DNA-damage-inducible F DinF domain protein [Mycobacterium ulcerans str. Harvey]|uniref:DNA-damage-inducible F DinF domain protein n=1 Tax=Mycobacterium ulcerans str. Harvey TaxID=1299332 RepID=A0ABP3AGV9_MYCUL|nr:DNA-damage-inducible F DinF domain protein [Mycobacterium ulcerans str. Harvey]
MGTPAILISLAGNGWMRGVQDTVRPLRYVVAGFGLSALLCPLLVYGWLGLPRMELAGSAVANLVGSGWRRCCSGARCSPSGCRCDPTATYCGSNWCWLAI